MRQFKQETYYSLSYTDFEDIVADVFKKPSYQIAEGWANHSVHAFDVRIADFDRWAQDDIEKFEKSNYSVSVESLLYALCARQEIPEGKYLIRVSY